MDSLIKGAYDLHVHSAPDILPRLMDDLDMIGRIRESGMAGYVIKSHYFCTAERATLINTMHRRTVVLLERLPLTVQSVVSIRRQLRWRVVQEQSSYGFQPVTASMRGRTFLTEILIRNFPIGQRSSSK